MTDAAAALGRVRWLGELLDSAVTVPVVGVEVGLDPIIGVVPVAGDAVAAALSLYIVLEAWLAGVGRLTLVRMLLNIAVDLVVGSIPLVGDAFDVAFRANERNVALFEDHVDA